MVSGLSDDCGGCVDHLLLRRKWDDSVCLALMGPSCRLHFDFIWHFPANAKQAMRMCNMCKCNTMAVVIHEGTAGPSPGNAEIAAAV